VAKTKKSISIPAIRERKNMGGVKKAEVSLAEDLLQNPSKKRRNQAKKSFFDIRNMPITLWLLSTVIVGSISFSYSQWIEVRETRERNRQLEHQLIGEMRFRILQMDSALDANSRLGSALINQLT
jgi:hypothetical protein